MAKIITTLAAMLVSALPCAAQPTVVFLPGLGDGANSFAGVVRDLGATPLYRDTRPKRIAGDEDGARTGAEIAADLHQRLAKSGIAPPYLMVGHSSGGTYALAFAAAYPSEVAGIVLADARLPAFEAACIAQHLKACKIPPLLFAVLPAVQKREVAGLELTMPALPAASAFAHVPMTVIVATEPAAGLGPNFQQVWIDTARRFAAQSQARLVVAKGSHHYVQDEARALVTAEVKRMLQKLP